MNPLDEINQVAKIMDEWLGDGAQPVDPPQSEWRASVCVECPKNERGGLWYQAKLGVSSLASRYISAKSSMAITTRYDGQLHGCDICKCVLSLKVHVPLKHLLEVMEPAQEQAFKEVNCWITREKEKYDELHKCSEVPSDNPGR